MPRPVSGDGDLDGIAGHSAGDVDSSVVGVVLDGVGQQVDEDLLDARGVATQHRGVGAQILGDLDAAPLASASTM